MIRAASFTLPLLLLAACGGGGDQGPEGANKADAEQLEEATSQMDPAAAAAVENAMDNGASPQEALSAGGNAQAATVGPAQQPADSSKGAKPHAPGDPVPPPKVDTEAPKQQ
jgi:hypothetical protein